MSRYQALKALVSPALKLLFVAAVAALAYAFGSWDSGEQAPSPTDADPTSRLAEPEPPAAAEDEKKSETTWTCIMHRQIHRPEPGQCPICSMDLIPVEQQSQKTEAPRLVMSEEAKKLAEIVTSPVERRFPMAEIRMVGMVDYDETRVRTISAWVGGRIERLYVDYTGVAVAKGGRLATIYSPDLLTAQEELIEAKRRVAQGGAEKSEFLRASDLRALESAREKLRLWGLDADQLREIEEQETAQDRIIIHSPVGGIVTHKTVQEGQYVQTGTHIYTVADLSKLWVLLDAYESDLSWLHYGQHVDIETEAYPGETFDGHIAVIDPFVQTRSRTVKVRVNVDNSDGRLKPGMFIRAVVHARVARGGRVMDPQLAGKWIGPMHPEIVRDEPGDCPICGMALKKAEDLGYVSAADESMMPLVVPRTAVLRTGRRAVVYVEVPGAERPTYEGRRVVLGPRAGEFYIVREGLAEGERVVVNGNFKIDSALQIRALPSMLNPPGAVPASSSAPPPAHVH